MSPAWILVTAQTKIYIWSYTNDYISDPMYSSLDCGRSSLDCVVIWTRALAASLYKQWHQILMKLDIDQL